MPAAGAGVARPAEGNAHAHVVRVMIVDDSIVARAVLARMLGNIADIAVVAQAGSGRAALAALATQPVDVILLDLEMPDLGGLDVLPELLAVGRGARVLVVSSAAGDGAAASVTALRLGAADTLLKPALGGLGADGFATILLDRVRRIAATDDAVAPLPPPAIATMQPMAPPAGNAIGCVAIGASTGGVHGLATFFAAYPAACDAPILVTQHLPAPFMPFFAGQLEEMAGRPTNLAVDGMALKPGGIILAPGDASITLQRTRGIVHVRLERRRAASGCLPSVDPMFAAVAREYGDRAIGVVLSGMGRDGLEGARAMAAAGADLIVQDAGSSVVWGMPGVVASAGLARAVMPPAALARLIARRAGQTIASSEGNPSWR